ncbi:hypothetical protein BpHYR1_039441 [Brachionus plicatilis]|uniref:Uncharacterized protein n=1 Tax=Brachionus plicatilis TaxID=10195 RepID=A0A3M7S3S3_BRAPC|nr:hypothetical protein BpHYR1_039441 [Brachionus plicatilis]
MAMGSTLYSPGNELINSWFILPISMEPVYLCQNHYSRIYSPIFLLKKSNDALLVQISNFFQIIV